MRQALPTCGTREARLHTVIRLVVTSDLHVDHHADAIPLLQGAIGSLEPDVLVVAGDLTADLDKLEATLSALRSHARAAVFVPGNHDLWCRKTGPDSRERYESLVPSRVRNAGFEALGNDPVRLFGHAFVGVTGWYDYSLRNRALDAIFTPEHYANGRYGLLQWSDKLCVRWPGRDGTLLDDPAICDEQVRALERQVAAVGDEPTIGVTHHLAFHELVTSKGEPPWDFLNGFMGSERLGQALTRANLKLAIAGHTHFRKDVTVERDGKTFRALTSPLGYPREYRVEGLPQRVIDRVKLVEL